MSTFSRDPADETWFVHAPLKNQKRPVVNAPPPSSIPYLNGIMDDSTEKKPNTLWFKETDSPFVRLSKIGGREDLLVHKHAKITKEPVGYPICQWWTDMLPNNNEKETNEKSHKFEIPAWFAHTSETTIKSAERTRNYGSSVDIYHNDQGIHEPMKYGQIRNYLHPVGVRSKTSNVYRQLRRCN